MILQVSVYFMVDISKLNFSRQAGRSCRFISGVCDVFGSCDRWPVTFQSNLDAAMIVPTPPPPLAAPLQPWFPHLLLHLVFQQCYTPLCPRSGCTRNPGALQWSSTWQARWINHRGCGCECCYSYKGTRAHTSIIMRLSMVSRFYAFLSVWD